MIKNIIFDMGNVLIYFNPDQFIARYPVDAQEAQLLKNVIFKSDEWLEMDEGLLSEDEACKIYAERLPLHLHEIMIQLVTAWDQPLLVVEGMEDLIKDLKEQGYHLYLLSNASRRQPDYWRRLPASKYFEGTLISADYQLLKPQPAIYQALFDKFDLLPQECFFIDDVPGNIAGGEALGMPGYVFDGNVDRLREKLASF